MAKRKLVLSTGEYYHVYNRGNSKQIIFLDEQDKRRFVKLMYLMNREEKARIDENLLNEPYSSEHGKIVAIGAYVIMDNHFHILIKQTTDEGITKYMLRLGTAYAMYFNKKYKRTGKLFEGTFKAKHANDDIYMRYLYGYIHLNVGKMVDPNWKKSVLIKRTDVIDFIKRYPYSSFHDYCGIMRPENHILSREEFPVYFRNTKEFVESILSWIKLEEKLI